MVNDAAVVVVPDRVAVGFDDERLVADAGVVLPAALAGRLGIEALVERAVDLGDRPGAANAGAKVMTLVSAMALGADSIDDCDILRSGSTAAVLGHRVAAPSTLGTSCARSPSGMCASSTACWESRSSGPGERAPARARSGWFSTSTPSSARYMAMPSRARPSAIRASAAITPLLASRSDTGEVLHIRLRKGSANTARGALRFIEELIARVERAGAAGEKLLRADSGFWSNEAFRRLERAGWRYSVGVRLQSHVRAAIEQIPDHAWQTLADYPPSSEAQIAETVLAGRRLIVRRVRTLDAQGELLPSWEHYPFLTNRTDALEAVESEHRQHAVVELCIRDLKDQALAHFPSGRFFANAAWTVISALAHNLLRWTSVLGLPGDTVRTARILRRRLLSLPGRLTRTARQWTLHLPARWPWQRAFVEALTRIRALPALT